MKKLYIVLFSILLGLGAMAQVTVTFQVDVTNYIEEFTVGATGMRIAGDFPANLAVANGMDAAEWNPDSDFGAMTDLGDNIWSIAVTYPESSIGNTQFFKFVNETWGTPGEANEGGDASLIATEGCGVDDGNGNINRTLVVPESDVTITYCWEQCLQCDGSEPITNVLEVNAGISGVEIFPNPTNSNTQVSYTLKQTNKVTVQLLDLLGKEVSNVFEGTQSFGEQLINVDMDGFQAGIYFIQITSGGSTQVSKVIKR